MLKATNPTRIPASSTPADSARKRQAKKDDAIRKKLETELSRKKKNPGSSGTGIGNESATRKGTKVVGTVSSLRPSPAITLDESAMLMDAARIMAAKRCDCILVVDEEERLSGIFTDKDLAFRVVAEGLDPRTTPISQVMTRNPSCCTDTSYATDALGTMANGGFRHLPVTDDVGDVVGVLDITKCLYEALEKIERAHGTSKKLVDALEGMEPSFLQPEGLTAYMNALRDKMSCPDLASVLDARNGSQAPCELGVRTTVSDAARMMKLCHQTAALVIEDGKLAGIFTTKDCVVRVIAAGLDPNNTSLVRVMTPHPDTVPSTMTILEALHKMHEGRYLHLPIVEYDSTIAGMVDVLQLTYATLDQVSSLTTQDSEGPMWNRFWQSTFVADEASSFKSGPSEPAPMDSQFLPPHPSTIASFEEGSFTTTPAPAMISRPPSTMGGGRGGVRGMEETEGKMKGREESEGEVVRDEKERGAGGDEGEGEEQGYTVVFKFRERSGAVHRFSVSQRTAKMEEFLKTVQSKLDLEYPSQDATKPEYQLMISYLDDENDRVVLANDGDLADALRVSERNRWPVMVLFVAIRWEGRKEWESLGKDDEEARDNEMGRRKTETEKTNQVKENEKRETSGFFIGTDKAAILIPTLVGIGAVLAMVIFRQVAK